MAENLNAPFHLTCEFACNPRGIDALSPRLSWWSSDERKGAMQSAYEIRCGSIAGDSDIWQSGKIQSDQSVLIPCLAALKSGQRVFWQVRTWNEADQTSPWSEPAIFEMGLLDRADWKSDWISPAVNEYTVPGPVIYARRDFTISRQVSRATLYATARGVYTPFVNGQRIGDDRLTPGWTDYSKRIRYQTYDITDALHVGANTVGAMLGDGWYCGHFGWHNETKIYGDRPALRAQLHIIYTDGSVDLITTDNMWRLNSDGPVTSSSFYDGDTIDHRRNLGTWSAAGYDAAVWQEPLVTPADDVLLIAQHGPTVRVINTLKPIAQWKLDSGEHVVDFGQNLVGVVRLRVSGTAGQTISLTHGEMLKGEIDRSVYTENLRSARNIDTFILRGEDIETFEPPFTLHGFRYVQIAGMSAAPEPDEIEALVIHSDTPSTGQFECSDARLNQLQRNIVWGQKGNFVEVPTDCPQRDERLGWMGDAQVFIRTAAFNMDVAGFFTRWLLDVRDAQRSSGAFTDVVPDILNNNPAMFDRKWGAPAWGDAGVICPWMIYLAYGDHGILKDSYDSIARYIQFLVDYSTNYVYPDVGYGDWLSIGSNTPKDLIGTAYSAYSAGLAARIAGILSRDEDAERFQIVHDSFKKAFVNEFVTPSGRMLGQSQTANVLALAFDLVDGAQRDTAIANLSADIEKRGVLTTGFVGVNLLLPTLTKIGRDDLAYALLTNEKFPSWLFSVNHGATTIWERWDGWTPKKGFQSAGMNSFNHYAYGSCGEWMYARIAGIDLDAEQPGYKHIYFRPTPGGGLTWAKGSLDSVYGTIEAAWKVEANTMTLSLRVPGNTTATLHAPGVIQSISGMNVTADQRSIELAAGRYEVRMTLSTDS